MLNVKINPVPNSWHGDTPEVLSGVTKTVYLELESKLSNILAYEYKNLFSCMLTSPSTSLSGGQDAAIGASCLLPWDPVPAPARGHVAHFLFSTAIGIWKELEGAGCSSL